MNAPNVSAVRAAAMQVDDLLDQRQADAKPALGAADRALALHERLEGALDQRRRHAG